jgi:hypothetical protein
MSIYGNLHEIAMHAQRCRVSLGELVSMQPSFLGRIKRYSSYSHTQNDIQHNVMVRKPHVCETVSRAKDAAGPTKEVF